MLGSDQHRNNGTSSRTQVIIEVNVMERLSFSEMMYLYELGAWLSSAFVKVPALMTSLFPTRLKIKSLKMYVP